MHPRSKYNNLAKITEWRKNNPSKFKAIQKRCYQKNHIKWYNTRAKKVRQLLHRLRINGCAICGYDKCDDALEFHHTNPDDKKFHLNREHMTYSNEKIADEINKCILLCANCHRELHSNENKEK